MAHPPVAADLLQTLDVLGALATEVTLDDDVGIDEVAQLDDLVLREVPDLTVGFDAQLGQQFVGCRAADAVDVGRSRPAC
jgi:hypothetical protein